MLSNGIGEGGISEANLSRDRRRADGGRPTADGRTAHGALMLSNGINEGMPRGERSQSHEKAPRRTGGAPC